MPDREFRKSQPVLVTINGMLDCDFIYVFTILAFHYDLDFEIVLIIVCSKALGLPKTGQWK